MHGRINFYRGPHAAVESQVAHPCPREKELDRFSMPFSISAFYFIWLNLSGTYECMTMPLLFLKSADKDMNWFTICIRHCSFILFSAAKLGTFPLVSEVPADAHASCSGPMLFGWVYNTGRLGCRLLCRIIANFEMNELLCVRMQ